VLVVRAAVVLASWPWVSQPWAARFPRPAVTVRLVRRVALELGRVAQLVLAASVALRALSQAVAQQAVPAATAAAAAQVVRAEMAVAVVTAAVVPVEPC
jgi:hypothetical protein